VWNFFGSWELTACFSRRDLKGGGCKKNNYWQSRRHGSKIKSLMTFNPSQKTGGRKGGENIYLIKQKLRTMLSSLGRKHLVDMSLKELAVAQQKKNRSEHDDLDITNLGG